VSVGPPEVSGDEPPETPDSGTAPAAAFEPAPAEPPPKSAEELRLEQFVDAREGAKNRSGPRSARGAKPPAKAEVDISAEGGTTKDRAPAAAAVGAPPSAPAAAAAKKLGAAAPAAASARSGERKGSISVPIEQQRALWNKYYEPEPSDDDLDDDDGGGADPKSTAAKSAAAAAPRAPPPGNALYGGGGGGTSVGVAPVAALLSEVAASAAAPKKKAAWPTKAPQSDAPAADAQSDAGTKYGGRPLRWDD
jgi:hypothetical protein